VRVPSDTKRTAMLEGELLGLARRYPEAKLSRIEREERGTFALHKRRKSLA
jgi:hypothetical protein